MHPPVPGVDEESANTHPYLIRFIEANYTREIYKTDHIVVLVPEG